ncbi:MAG: hypothetical protein WBB18_16375 [Nodosilinea sp.]
MTPKLIASPVRLNRPSQVRSRSRLGPVCVAASLAVHVALLALVLPNSEKASSEAAETMSPPETIAVTVLPNPIVEAYAAEVTAAEEPVAEGPLEPASGKAPAPPPAAQQAQAQINPLAQAQPEPELTLLRAESAPKPSFEPPSTPLPEPQPAAPAPYADFPHLSGAQSTCAGLVDCWRSPVSSSWRGAAGDLQAQLEVQGYTVNNVTDEVLSIDSGVRVYAVSKPGESNYYLSLVSVRDGVLYTMTAEPMTSDQVLALQSS